MYDPKDDQDTDDQGNDNQEIEDYHDLDDPEYAADYEEWGEKINDPDE